MRKWLLMLTAGLLTVATITTAGMAEDFKLKPWQEKAKSLAKKEKKILDALWSQPISFWVSVKDDGTPRKGYAEYVCLLLSEAGKPKGEIIIVSVIDHYAMLRGELRILGKAGCM